MALLGKKQNILIFKYLLILVFIYICNIGNGQNLSSSDTTYLENSQLKIHSPHKATMYSALVPGLGQIYNKKYWKLPVIYGATGILIYAFDFNNDQYNKYKRAYTDLHAGRIESFQNITDEKVLLRAKDKYERDRTLNVILLAAVYLLNVMDATVDAHLFDYKITKDLSLKMQPSIKQYYGFQKSYGVSLQINF